MTTTEAAAILRSDALCTVGPSRDARMMGAEALDRIATLERALAEAKRDVARLDWLETVCPYEGMFGNVLEARDLIHGAAGWGCGNNVLGGWYRGETAREAIDSAMKGPNATK